MLFSPGFSVEYAKNYLQNSQLTTDDCHMSEGLPCIIGAYEVVLSLARYYGLPQRILNNQLRLNSSKWQSMNIPGPNGTPDYSFTDNDYVNCQKSAIAGYKTSNALFETVQAELFNEIQN